MGKKLWLDEQGRARVDRRLERINHPRLDRVHSAYRHIAGAVAHTTDTDDAIVAQAKRMLRCG